MTRALLAAASRGLMYQRRSQSSSAVSVTKARSRAAELVPTREGETEAVAPSESLNPSSMAWIPDPVTGYYRPANLPREMDGTEMRERFPIR